MANQISTIIKISPAALKKGVVVLDIDTYKKLQEAAAPTYCLTGRKAKALDMLVKEGLKEYRSGKARPVKSLKDLR